MKLCKTKTACMNCLLQGYCPRQWTRLVSDEEIKNPDFVRDVKTYAHSLNLTPAAMKYFIRGTYYDYPGRIMGPDGEETFLEMTLFEVSDETHFTPDDVHGATQAVTTAHQNILTFFADYSTLPNMEGRTYVRKEAFERFRVFATALRIHDPVASRGWGLK